MLHGILQTLVAALKCKMRYLASIHSMWAEMLSLSPSQTSPDQSVKMVPANAEREQSITPFMGR